MITLLRFLQTKIRPDLNDRPTPTRYLLMGDVVALIYSLPLVILGLLGLWQFTDWQLFSQHWLVIGLIFLAILIFSRLRFYMLYTLRTGQMISSDGDFVGVILWTAMLLFGYFVIWVFLVGVLFDLVLSYQRSIDADMRWSSLRSASLNAASLLVPALFSLLIYQNLGGSFPIGGLNYVDLYPALMAVLGFALIYFLVWLPFIIYMIWVQNSKFGIENAANLFWFSMLTLELPLMSLVFGILASGIYIEHGTLILGLYFLGIFLIGLLANQLSRSAERSRRQAAQLMELEQLGRNILAAPADARDLPSLLRNHIPRLFPCRRAAVWLAPETYLLRFPDGKDSHAPEIWDWILRQKEQAVFLEDSLLPWKEVREEADSRHFAMMTSPILDQVTGQPIGGIFVELLSLPQAWDRATLRSYCPALHNLASQITTSLRHAEDYQETLKLQRVNQELRIAGEIQSSFLPEQVPNFPEWDIAASLMPARQTSGDFYDFFDLGDDRMGMIIADVADKGLGAALYMALGRTLLLTFAQVYPDNPAAVLQATNQRMLQDARAQMFITAFYGVLELRTGRLICCNAGHHPPLLFCKDQKKNCAKLNPNGMALGIDPDAAWVAVSQQIGHEDVLLLYTDGVVEAVNSAGDFYGTQRLADTAAKIAYLPSQWVINAILDDVMGFQDGESPSDDMTMICLRRR